MRDCRRCRFSYCDCVFVQTHTKFAPKLTILRTGSDPLQIHTLTRTHTDPRLQQQYRCRAGGIHTNTGTALRMCCEWGAPLSLRHTMHETLAITHTHTKRSTDSDSRKCLSLHSNCACAFLCLWRGCLWPVFSYAPVCVCVGWFTLHRARVHRFIAPEFREISQ